MLGLVDNRRGCPPTSTQYGVCVTSPLLTESTSGREVPTLVALDIDGTLLDADQQLAPGAREAVRIASARAHVVLATGRAIVSTKVIAEGLGLTDGYAVCSNGAVIAELGSFRPVDVTTFDPAPAVGLLLRYVPDALVAVEDLGVGNRVSAPFPPGDLSGLQRVEPIESLISRPVPRVIVNRPGWTSERLIDVVSEIGLHGVTYAIGTTAWLDLAPAGVTKASALERVRSWLEVPRERTLAVGDGRNDVDMLRWAGRGLAMGNATPDVHDAADEVIGHVDDGGLVRELHRLFG